VPYRAKGIPVLRIPCPALRYAAALLSIVLVGCGSSTPAASSISPIRAGQAGTPAIEATIGKIARPKTVRIVPDMPKTRSGKIMRRVLKAQELGIDPCDITTIEE